MLSRGLCSLARSPLVPAEASSSRPPELGLCGWAGGHGAGMSLCCGEAPVSSHSDTFLGFLGVQQECLLCCRPSGRLRERGAWAEPQAA